MNRRTAFLIFFCPIFVVMLAVCLAINECNKSDIEKQNVTIMILKEQNDSLFKANNALKIKNQELLAAKKLYLKLDVTGVSHRGGGVIVNNTLPK